MRFLKNVWKTIQYSMELAGMVRAAEELKRMGYEKEYKLAIDRIRRMKI